MYFSKLPYILYRDYPDFGYLTDNRNFGYDTASRSCVKVGDRILSKSGSLFYSVLSEEAQNEHEVAKLLLTWFHGTSLDVLENDAKEFYLELAKDGFVHCGKSKDDFPRNHFSYNNWEPLELGVDDSPWEGESLSVDWGTKHRLSRLHVDVSGLCNEHCVHCYIPDSYRIKTMPGSLFQEILRQGVACKVLNITISGGEPMLNPELLCFIRLCREENFSINLLSNLTLLTNEMLHEFEITPLLSIQTSLYSMDEKVHDSITKCSGSYIRTKRAIEILHEHNIPMQINCPIMKQNKDSYHAVLDWAKSLNIEASSDYMLFGSFDGSGRNLQCRLMTPEVESIILNEGLNDSGLKKKKGFANKEEDVFGSSICPVCISSLCVSHTGDVYPCEGWQSLVFGNIKQTPLSTIWEESEVVNHLRSLTYMDFPKCQSCEAKDMCSICLIRNVNESSNLDYMDMNPYFCEIARIKKQLAKRLENY